jgi:hypothetical protein
MTISGRQKTDVSALSAGSRIISAGDGDGTLVASSKRDKGSVL